MNTAFGRHRFTRNELHNAVAHDHTYCLPTDKASTCLTPLSNVGVSIPSVAISTSLALFPVIPPQRFSVERIADNVEAVQFYTSFPSYSHFMVCFNFLGNAVNHLTIPRSAPSEKPPSNGARCQRILSPKNEFFLTLCQLRCGLMEVDLAYRFHVSQTTVSRICIT